MTCSVNAAAPVSSNRAGASAGREYARRRAVQEDRARDRLGALGVILARVVGEPQSTQAWKTGARGEERVGKRLAKRLAGTEVKLLHDRRMPRGAGNIDHIAIGPGGITVIDTKNYRGKIRAERIGGLFSKRRTVLMIAGRDRTNLIDGVEKQIDAVRDLVAALSPRPIDVRGALCFVDPDGLSPFGRQSVRGVLVDSTGAVAKLSRRPGLLGEEQIANLYEELATALPAA